jgi:spermidine synthase
MTYGKPLLLGFVGVLAACAAATAAPKVLYQKASPYNQIVVTEDDDGLRTLSFGNGVRQSVVKPGDPDHLELRYARAMPAALALVEEPRRVLIVGLGGGTVPSFLHKHYPRTAIDVVDIDPDVLAVAKQFFGFREDSLMRAHVADGRKFIEDCRDPYDVILLDAFGPDSTPYHLATREFLQAVRRALTPKGIVAGNVFSEGLNPLYSSMVRTYQDVFREVYILDVSGAGNKILIGLPWQGRFQPDDVARRARRIYKEKQFRFDMGDLVASGFRQATAISPAGHVLTDKDKP